MVVVNGLGVVVLAGGIAAVTVTEVGVDVLVVVPCLLPDVFVLFVFV